MKTKVRRQLCLVSTPDATSFSRVLIFKAKAGQATSTQDQLCSVNLSDVANEIFDHLDIRFTSPRSFTHSVSGLEAH